MALQALVGTLVLVGIGLSTRGVESFKERAAEAWQKLGYEPVVALVGFYFLQVTRRYTEGQSGANVLFILGLAPAIVLLLSAWSLPRRKAVSSAVSILIAVLGVVAVLANWERPSSFSPFAFFPMEELLLLGAAACWAALLVFVKDRIKGLDPLAGAAVVLGVTTLVLLVAAVVRDGPAAVVLDGPSLRLVVLLGVFGAALGCYSWFALVSTDFTPVEISSAILVAPAVLSLLIFIDQAQGLTGPNPMIGEPVLVGSLLSVLGVVGVWTAGWWELEKENGGFRLGEMLKDAVKSPLNLAISVSGVGALVAAITGMALPVKSSMIEGEVGEGTPYAAKWITYGVEGAGAWIALVAALIILLLGWAVLRGVLSGSRMLVGVGIVAALLAVAPYLSDSLFVAWRSWMPADIQHAIGTPYASLSQSRVPNPAFVVVDAAAAIALLSMIVKILWRKQKAS